MTRLAVTGAGNTFTEPQSAEELTRKRTETYQHPTDIKLSPYILLTKMPRFSHKR